MTINEISFLTNFIITILIKDYLKWLGINLTSKSKMAADAILKNVKGNISFSITNLMKDYLKWLGINLTSKSKMAANAILKNIKKINIS